MKKLLLLLLLSLGFIGPVYAAKNAGLALAYGFGSVSISVAIGFVLFMLIKPKKDSENKKAVYYGRLFLAYILWIQTAAIFPQFVIHQNINTFMAWLVGMIAFGFIAYVIGSVYGASKKTAGKLVKKTKTITKTAIEKTVEKPIKKTVEKPQELATKKYITKNENTMDDENSDEINDEEFYLIATNEVEGEDIDSALWAKCMAINMGDEKKSKYDYINKRAAILTNDAKQEVHIKETEEETQRIELAVAEKEKIENDKTARQDLYLIVTKEVEADHFDYKLYEKCIAEHIEGKRDSAFDAAAKFGVIVDPSKTKYHKDGAKALYIDKRVEMLFKEREEAKKREVTKEQEVTSVEKKADNYSKDGIKFKSKEDYETYIRLHSNDKK